MAQECTFRKKQEFTFRKKQENLQISMLLVYSGQFSDIGCHDEDTIFFVHPEKYKNIPHLRANELLFKPFQVEKR